MLVAGVLIKVHSAGALQIISRSHSLKITLDIRPPRSFSFHSRAIVAIAEDDAQSRHVSLQSKKDGWAAVSKNAIQPTPGL